MKAAGAGPLPIQGSKKTRPPPVQRMQQASPPPPPLSLSPELSVSPLPEKAIDLPQPTNNEVYDTANKFEPYVPPKFDPPPRRRSPAR